MDSLNCGLRTGFLLSCLGLSHLSTGLSIRCPYLGQIQPARWDKSDSFLAQTGVKTFVCQKQEGNSPVVDSSVSVAAHELSEMHDKWGPAIHLLNVLAPEPCIAIQRVCEESLGFDDFCAGKNEHGALQLLVSQNTADAVAKRIEEFIDVDLVEQRMQESECLHDSESSKFRLRFAGINRRWRVYRYQPNARERFAPHIDGGFPPSGLDENGNFLFDMGNDKTVSRLTLLLYLSDDFQGGKTVFYRPSSCKVLAQVSPVTGSALIFPQAVGVDAVEYARQRWPLHEGSVLRSGNEPKYVIRSDVLFQQSDEYV